MTRYAPYWPLLLLAFVGITGRAWPGHGRVSVGWQIGCEVLMWLRCIHHERGVGGKAHAARPGVHAEVTTGNGAGSLG